MRISDRQWYGQQSQRIQDKRLEMSKLQEQLASGKAVNRPSDDPTAFNRLESLRHRLSGLDTFDANSEVARRKLQTAETSMDEIFNVLGRTRELTLMGMNSTVSATNRQDIAQELGVLRDHFVQLSNTRFDNQYVFSGTATDTPPLDDTGNYQGGGAGSLVAIGDGAQVDLALNGGEIFNRDINTLTMLDDIISDLENNDLDSLNTRLSEIDLSEAQLSQSRSRIGAKMRRVEITTEVTADIRAQLSLESSKIGDADIASVISDLVAQEQSLQAAVKIAGRTMTPSLLDIL